MAPLCLTPITATDQHRQLLSQVYYTSCGKAMHNANCAVVRCLSVRPSVTRQYSVKTAKYIIVKPHVSGFYRASAY